MENFEKIVIHQPFWSYKALFNSLGETKPLSDVLYSFLKEVSPLFHIDKIKKPLFVIQGGNNPRVNINESDQIVEGLRGKGFTVPYMVKYDEGHGFYKEENRINLYKTMQGFLAENLKYK